MPEPLYCGPVRITRGRESRDLGWCSISRAFPYIPLDETPAVVVDIVTQRGRRLSAIVSRGSLTTRRIALPTHDGAPFLYWETRLPLPCGAIWRGTDVELA